MKPERRFDPLAAALLVVLVAKAAVVLATLDRGFEMGDEGYFLLNWNHAEAALPPFEIYRAVASVTGGAPLGVVLARALRIGAEIAGSAVLVVGVYAWARVRLFQGSTVGPAEFGLFCGLGALISVASRSLGYNDLTNLLTYAAIGCLFLMAALPADERRHRFSLAALAGGLTACQLGVKFPSAFLVVAVFVVTLGFSLGRTTLGTRLGSLGAYGAALLAVGAALVVASGGPGDLADKLAVASQLPALTGYGTRALLARYLLIEQWTLSQLAGFLLVAGGTFAALRSWRGRAGALHGATWVSAIALVGFGLFWQPGFMHGSLVYLTVLLLGSTLGLLALRLWPGRRAPEPSPEHRATREEAVLLLVLLVVPFLMIAGTNVGVTMRLPTHAMPLFALLGLLSFDLRERWGAVGFHRSVVLLLGVVTTGVFVQHHGLEPYGLRSPIHQQRSAVRGLPGVHVDLATKVFLEDVSATLDDAGFRPGDPVIAFDYMPGLVFYLGGTSPRYNLYMFDQPALNCFNANRARFETPPFLILGRPMSPAQADCLETIDFPAGFELIRTLRFPYEEVYAGFGRPGFSHVRLYAPRPVPAAAP